MSKIVVLSVPAYGHINPLLPIVRELVRRGHDVTVFNEASFEPLIVAATQARFAAYPPVIAMDDFSRTLHGGDLTAWLEMIMTATGPILREVHRQLAGSPPDMLVFDGVAIWGEILAKKLAIPSVAISTTFTFEYTRDLHGNVGRFFRSAALRLPSFLRAWRGMAQLGIRHLPRTFPLFPRQGDITLLLTSEQVHPKSLFVPNPRFAFVGPSLAADTRAEAFDFERLDGRPLVYVSLGTLHNGNVEFFRTSIAALSRRPYQVLISVGRNTDIAQFSNLPENVIVANAVPQLRILERSRIFLTHGGLNSVHESLWHGVPMISVPHQAEQLSNSLVVSEAGAGLTLRDEVGGGRLDAARLLAAFDELEAGYAAFRQNAERLGRSLQDAGGSAAAVDRIEAHLAPTRQPALTIAHG